MRRFITAPVRLALAFALLFAASAVAQVTRVASVESVGFTVTDMDRSVDFYSKVLDFRKVSDERIQKSARRSTARVVRMQLGAEQIELTQFLSAPGKAFPADTRANDRWFQHVAIITSNMDTAYARLRANHVRHASNAPQTLPEWNNNAANIRAFYFRDPDGHFLEVLQFPPDKGRAKWHRVDTLFLGIDHTAIVVSDTDASLRFYRDQLGMKVAGESDNYGVEQEHLNGVFGAHLRITALRAENGPGIELLEYLSPLDGRPYPSDAKPNDVLHWETRLIAPSFSDASPNSKVGNSFASPKQAADEPETKDPDGHVLILCSQTAHSAHVGPAMSQATEGGNR